MGEEHKPHHSQSVEHVLKQCSVRPDQGLSEDEVNQRRGKHGPNKLREAKGRSVWDLLISQFKSVVILVLVAACIAAFAFGEWVEGIAIVAVIIVNTVIGFVSEWKAVRSMEALRSSEQISVRVRRSGHDASVPQEDLVPGDIVYLEGGDVIPADLRFIESNGLRVKEAALTGESVPVHKQVDPVAEDAPLAERHSMGYSSTVVTEGSGRGVIVAIGMDTEIGQISEMAEEAESERTPLERQLNRLGRRLAYITLGVAVVVAAAGVIAGRETVLMIETAIALGVAAIPEGLPIVATIALARGMYLMAKRNAVINVLTAVETLGATRIILTDKTGTLTENDMRLRKLAGPGGELVWDDHSAPGGDTEAAPSCDVRRMLEIGVLCNNAALAKRPGADDEGEGDAHGDPTEVALLLAAADLAIDKSTLSAEHPEIREVPFDSRTMMMATYHESEGGIEVAVKGAPAAVLAACTTIAGDHEGANDPFDPALKDEWEGRMTAMAAEGLRLLAVADKRVDSAEAEPYEDLRFVGLFGLFDPPRSDVRNAIAECKAAGIRVVMVTGDQPETARAIAAEVGLIESRDERAVHGADLKDWKQIADKDKKDLSEVNVFARVSPRQKLNLVQLFQEEGYTVAMTGDGVNDAPALKKADIGIAMGKRGTAAARQVSDMVLRDDALSSIAAAVEQGRIIFSNIRKSVLFMLCTNVAEIIAVTVASLAKFPIPLLPLHILYLNVLTDVFPALALGMGKGTPGVMQEPPRPAGEPVLTRRYWRAVAGWAVVVGACVLGGLLIARYWLDLEEGAAVTVSFMTLGFSKLLFVFNLRSRGTTLASNDIVQNPYVWGSIALCAILLLAAVYLPGLSTILQTRPIGWQAWLVVLLMSLLPFILGQAIRAFQHDKVTDSDSQKRNGSPQA